MIVFALSSSFARTIIYCEHEFKVPCLLCVFSSATAPHGSIRFTEDDAFGMNKPHMLYGRVNILSTKIASSDVGYPIRVYGTIIARDCIDKKCVYLYRHPRDRSQLINSKVQLLLFPTNKQCIAKCLATVVVEALTRRAEW